MPDENALLLSERPTQQGGAPMTALRTVTEIPPGVEPDFDGHLFDAECDDDAVTCPACGGRCRVKGENCQLCDGQGRVAL